MRATMSSLGSLMAQLATIAAGDKWLLKGCKCFLTPVLWVFDFSVWQKKRSKVLIFDEIAIFRYICQMCLDQQPGSGMLHIRSVWSGLLQHEQFDYYIFTLYQSFWPLLTAHTGYRCWAKFLFQVNHYLPHISVFAISQRTSNYEFLWIIYKAAASTH